MNTFSTGASQTSLPYQSTIATISRGMLSAIRVFLAYSISDSPFSLQNPLQDVPPGDVVRSTYIPAFCLTFYGKSIIHSKRLLLTHEEGLISPPKAKTVLISTRFDRNLPDVTDFRSLEEQRLRQYDVSNVKS